MSHPGARPEFNYELLAIFVRSELTASLAIPLLAVVVAVGLLPWSPVEALLLWLATVFISKGILILLCRRFQMMNRKQIDCGLWRRYLSAAEFFYGTTWASVVFVDVTPGDQRSAFFFLFAAIMVVVAMRTMFASTVLRILYAGTIPMTTALVLRFALAEQPFYWAMAAVAVGIHVYLDLPRQRPAIDGAGHAGIPRRKGRAGRRIGAGQGRLRRSAAPRRGRQSGQVEIPRQYEPRIAHAAQRDPGLFRDDEHRNPGADREPDLQGLFAGHPQ